MKKKMKSKKPPKNFVGENNYSYSNVHWKEVLDEIYNRVPNAFGPGKFKHENKNPIAKKLKITDQELYQTVIYLSKLNLIEIRNEGLWTNMYPTSKGFDVALQNEKIKVDLKRQLGILLLTAVIALTTMFSFIFSLGIYDSNIVIVMYVISLIAIIVILFSKNIHFNLTMSH